jgi:basic membrane protein A
MENDRARTSHSLRLIFYALVVATALFAGVGCGGDDAEAPAGEGTADAGAQGAGGGADVAALFTQSVSQGNWDPAGYKAFTAMAKKYDLNPTQVERATYEKAPAILRDLASKGTKLVILHSSGYAAAVEEVAPDFPDTEFVLFSYAEDTKGLDNYSAWSMDWDQYGFVVGAIAALASQSGKIAIVAGEEIPSTKRTIEYISRGAKEVRSDAQLSSTYIGSWTDAAKGKEIALQALAQGADFLIPVADTAGAGVQQAADENGALTLGEYIDQSESYPSSVVTSTIVDMDGAYDEIGKAFTDGTLKGQIVQMNVEKGDLSLVTPFKHVESSVEEQAKKLLDDIASGAVDVQKETS